MNGEDRTFFGFEADFVESLRCIPMAVRLRLDVSGVKLKLNEWSKLNQAERRSLVETPCGSQAEIAGYREALTALATRVCGAPPSLLADLPEPVWENGTRIPDQVLQQAKSLGLEITLRDWASLSPLQRFALVKLSRPGHENRNFLPAMKEFGLASAG